MDGIPSSSTLSVVFVLKTSSEGNRNLKLKEVLERLGKIHNPHWADSSESPNSNSNRPGKPVPNIKQCPLNPEALARIQQIIQEYKTQDLIVPYTGLCNIPILPIEKPQGGEWRFAQDLKAIHNTVINCYPVALDLHALLMAIPTE